MDESSQLGFIVDCFAGRLGTQDAVFAVGRLGNDETFGLVDDSTKPKLFVRASDGPGAAIVVSRAGAKLVPTELRTMSGEPVLVAEMARTKDLLNLDRDLKRLGFRTYEADLDLSIRYLKERNLRSTVTIAGLAQSSDHVNRVFRNPLVKAADFAPKLRVLAFDIETDAAFEAIVAVSIVVWDTSGSTAIEEVHLVTRPLDKTPAWLIPHPDEATLLDAFAKRVTELDPDILTGWNVIDFDLAHMEKRAQHLKRPFKLGRTKQKDFFLEGRGYQQSRMEIRGRQVLDAMRLVRSTPGQFADMRLDTVAKALLNHGKTIVVEEWEDTVERLAETYAKDPIGFANYCLEDSRLVRDILKTSRLIELSISRSRLIGLPMQRCWGSVVPFEFLYMSALNRRGFVAPSRGSERQSIGEVPGGLVLTPEAGLYDSVLAFDFKSLYPSLIRTFNIDPWAHAQAPFEKNPIVAPNGAAFSRARGILPEILAEFFSRRESAQRSGQKIDAYVYKIIMNSFYGVLGTESCRFASGDLAGAITGFGHTILRWTKSYFEAQGYHVLYGDTDSLFIDTHMVQDTEIVDALARGKEIAAAANAALATYIEETFGLPSQLDLEFEKYYRRFLLPKNRGGLQSRAKTYAGLACGLDGERLEMTGMEAVRSDWTEVAKSLQRTLLQMIFARRPAADITLHIHTLIAELRAGQHDALLVYRKRIRRPLESYQATTPPHIKAARQLPRAVRVIRYLMTKDGPQPLGFVRAPIDYEHYIKKQIMPIAAGLASTCDFAIPNEAAPEPGVRSLFGD